MDVPAAQFGFDEPPVPCFPPGYDENMQVTCPDVLVKPAYEPCIADTAFFQMLHEDQMLSTMSMSMSMSMAMDEDDDFNIDIETHVMESFCIIMDSLTTEKSLDCLGMICERSMTSVMPSSSPSLGSDMPSSTPSLRPSSGPSQPSASTSAAPSLSPTMAPSFLPSRMPSSAPSMAPSSAPSSTPTLIVSKPEGAQSSSANSVSIGIASLVLLVATLFATL